jgi:hypothetical protein
MDDASTTAPDTRLDVWLDTPRDGDLVVAVDPSSPGHFTLRQVPNAPQISWNSRAAAIDVANGFARRHAVDVWTSDGQRDTRVQRYRPRDPMVEALARRSHRSSVATGQSTNVPRAVIARVSDTTVRTAASVS